ncbi:6-carboxytetrahydropterin synthase QueD [Megasphaera hominis]|jgi:6-pyruvoyltetrahydropterin/6-carboxytetrahydropterin synthase|uniref:6-carboxy-5,6,7,8-tetrahydropterin synthase n=1 Tax=Megasphaera hominis TaxID=159836 RepID=A0ABR6VHL8_9FIRM|nr:6-carboxytetrahydropterin synthase QueD [Megasphaera hominis]MBC3536711.1 6-carboxytetrahydropterin synthase QueD [Megasphaera hominis]
MYYLKTEQCFDAAHFLQGYDGKCHNLHGHRWRVVVEIKADTLQEGRQCRGMVIDFSELKHVLKDICDYFDHSFIFEKNSLRPLTLAALRAEDFCLREVPFRPTAEEFSRYIYETIQAKGYDLSRVDVYETPNNCASYGG